MVHNSVKGAEADVVYVFPDVSRAGMAEWIGNSAQRGRGLPALLRCDDPGQGDPGAVRPRRQVRREPERFYEVTLTKTTP